ncbi:LOW QUALITY PROTEIN: transmembrane protease serine 11B-like [Trichechus inunguis]
MLALIMLGVMAILGLIIGLLVHFLAVGRAMSGLEATSYFKILWVFLYFTGNIYYYQGNFRIFGVTYNNSCENAASQAGTPLSKDIESQPGYGRQLTNSIRADNRIVNGKKAQAEAWPWQASMQWKGKQRCGASLISSKWLLSAAHCFAKKNNSEDWTVNFGTIVNKPHMAWKVQNIIFHENYGSPELHDDIALVQLVEEVVFRKYVHRICLPEAKMKLKENHHVVVTGWGMLYMNGHLPMTLEQALVKIIDNKNCNPPYALSGMVTDNMFCAGFMSGEADSCHNGSGGPLAYPDSRDIWHLVGIVSWGKGCSKKNKPGVYTRVTSYCDIASKTGI